MRGNTTEAVRPTGTKRRRTRGVAAVVGLLACSGLVWQSSHATFTAQTVNTGNTFGAGTVAIADDDGSTAMFNATQMAPGDTNTVCMAVTYTGSLAPTAIKMYLPQSAASESNAGGAYGPWADSNASEMDDDLLMHIEVNNADLNADPGFNSCGSGLTFTDVVASTSLRTLISTDTAYASTALSSPAIAQNKWRVFRFTYQLPTGTPDTAQGDGVKFGVTWEAQR